VIAYLINIGAKKKWRKKAELVFLKKFKECKFEEFGKICYTFHTKKTFWLIFGLR